MIISNGPFGGTGADVVGGDCHGLLEASAQAVELVLLCEGRSTPSLGQLSEAACGIAGPVCASEHRGVYVGGEDVDRQRREPVGELGLPQDCERVRLLARRASRTRDLRRPDPGLITRAASVGSTTRARVLEDSAVSVEARDRDRGQLVERRPLLGMCFEVCAVSGDVGQSELARAPARTVAHLAADFRMPAQRMPGLAAPIAERRRIASRSSWCSTDLVAALSG